MIHWREEWQKHQFVIPKSVYVKGWKQGIQSALGYRVLQCTAKYWALLGYTGGGGIGGHCGYCRVLGELCGYSGVLGVLGSNKGVLVGTLGYCRYWGY